jgi:D-alanyl-D-alanine carboxypeptidase
MRLFHAAAAAIAAAVLGLAALPALAQDLSPATRAAIDAAMRKVQAEGTAPGGAVAVMRGGKVVFARGYGMANLETATPATAQTVFRIGSVTKQFTAAAVLLPAEDGKLSLDDKLSRYVPEAPMGERITLLQLLTHTAGVANYTERAGFARETLLPHDPKALLAYILAQAPLYDFEPGSRWAYSNSDYALAGLVIERVSGQPLGVFLKARLFDPLGLKDTALDDAADVVQGRASGYERVAGRPGVYANTNTISMTVPYGAGALRSTVLDLARWQDALIHGRVLAPDSFRRMTTPVRLNDGSQPTQPGPDGKSAPVDYGLGLFIARGNAGLRIFHSGGIDGFASNLTTYVDKDTIVAIAVNASPNDRLPFGAVNQAVAADIAGGGR